MLWKLQVAEGIHSSKVWRGAWQFIVGQVPEMNNLKPKKFTFQVKVSVQGKEMFHVFFMFAYRSRTFVRLLMFEGTGPSNELPSKRLFTQEQCINTKSRKTSWTCLRNNVDTYTTSRLLTSPSVDGIFPTSLLLSKSLPKKIFRINVYVRNNEDVFVYKINLDTSALQGIE